MNNAHFLSTLKRSLGLICLVFFINACSIYKPELQQGNLLTADQISKLQVGMPKSQVQLLLGSPLLQDVFHANRWEYIFRQVKGEKTLEQRVFTVEFDASGKVIKWTGIGKGDNARIDLNGLLQAASTPKTPSVPALEVNQLPLIVTTDIGLPATSKIEPTPIAAPETALAAAQDGGISAALESWRAHWEKANFAGYIAHYSPTFAGSSRNRAEWEKDRKRMVAGRKIESLTISQLVVQKTSDQAARAYFKQDYQAANFKQSGEKTLLLERVKGEWLIVSETFNKA